MSERASLSLSELAWSLADAGALGEAFQTLSGAEGSDAEDVVRIRAELAALCGDEDAALGALAGLDLTGEEAPLVRALVAASRGDWETVLRWAAEPGRDRRESIRAAIVRARAWLELGKAKEALEVLDATETRQATDALLVSALRARAHGDIEGLARVARRARDSGAVRIEAEAWADLAALHRSRNDDEEARRARRRALELWDDMATSLRPRLREAFWNDSRRRAVRDASKPATDGTASLPAIGLPSLLASLRRVASERDLSTLLSLITDGAVALCGAERGFVLLADEHGALVARTIRHAEHRLGKETAAFSRSIAETVLIDREPVVTVDAARDARIRDYMSVHQLMLKSVACLPIESHGRMWGVLYLEHRSACGRFTGADLSMLRAFADQAAIAIETAHLFEKVDLQRQALEKANAALREANAQLEQRLDGQTAALRRTRREIQHLQGATARGEPWGLVGASEGMRRVYELLERVAANDVPVVITGESGTGKELVARAIHRGGRRADKPYVSLNCGAIPEGLLESELFGHVAGAFTGATCARDGVFVQAHEGTLFMDEIADMPPRMQLDLLRVLQERRVRPVGATDDEPVDVRVITAAKRPLSQLIEEGKLREDLYYRLAVVELRLPPLRERRADIPLLCDHFLRRIAKERDEPTKRLSRSAVQRLCNHDFPGNVRELEHLLINACVFANGHVIEAQDLTIQDFVSFEGSIEEPSSYQDFKDAERERILAALNAHGWNRARAARSLGIARRTFYRRLKQHGIELPDPKA